MERFEFVETVCELIQQSEGKITLSELSTAVHVSAFHLQRTFKQVMGVSPHQYAQQYRTLQLKDKLQQGQAVTQAMYEAGYSSSSRLYETATEILGMTPATYKRGGKGMTIHYTIQQSLVGRMILGATDKGICVLYFRDSDMECETALRQEFPQADKHRDDNNPQLKTWAQQVENHLRGDFVHAQLLQLPMDVQATAFQARVWDILRTIPIGETRSYSEVAKMLGQPTATRAVARACATNNVAVIIPCHRVVREDGHLSGYRWGMPIKERLLATENAKIG
jgi:AraC family transcriptional regulator, regulatory protein of adaptative response / methylated-DNA-[protein]-cysteine methyltransferase